MNFLGLARRSVTRKPVKSILLLLVVFVISTLLLTGMVSQNASIHVQDKTRQAIGAGLLLEGNEEYRSKKLDKAAKELGDREGTVDGYTQKKEIINGTESWMISTDNSFETLKLDDITKIANTNGIEDYNITTQVTAVNPVNFKRIEDQDVDQSSDIKGVSLIGSRKMEMDFNVLSGNLSIKKGRFVQPDDTDVCVVSEELAQKNRIQLGDKLKFNDYHDTEKSAIYEAEVIGIYQVKQKMTSIMHGDTFRSENIIFTDLNFPYKPEGESSPLFQQAYFKVGNVEEYETIKENVKQTDINWEQYDLIDNNGNLETMSSNFQDLEKISQIMMLVVSIASFMILVFVFLFWLKNRVQEVGIFLSLGIPKLRIIRQIWTEALMITVLAVVLSFAVTPTVSKATTDYLVGQQVQKVEEEKKTNEGKVATDYQEPEQDIQEIEVSITPNMYLLDVACVLVLITASIFVACIVILRRNPKEILSEMS